MTDATYLYCIVKAAKTPSLAKTPRGLPGCGKPRVLDAGKSLWLVVCHAPLAHLGEEAIAKGLKDLGWVSARAIAHEQVVEHFARALGSTVKAIVPAKLFTLFASDERALDFVRRERSSIERATKRVEGRLEWGVRLSFDEQRALADAAAKGRKAAGSAKTGAAFLLRKKKARDAVREVSALASANVADTYDALARAADDAVRRPIPATAIGAQRVLLDAAFLVSATREKAFKTAVKRLSTDLGKHGYEITLTGPWPPYNFIAGAA